MVSHIKTFHHRNFFIVIQLVEMGKTTRLLREQFNNPHLKKKLQTWKPPPNYLNLHF